MQQQRSAGSSSLVDPYTETKYALADGEIEITPKGKTPRTFPLPNIGTDARKDNNRFYLKFTKKNQPHVTISPQGTLIASKSDRIQQVDMNISLDRGQIWWELFVPHTTLILAVGVKDKKQSVFFTFDFCLKNATKLQFKLNVDNLTFKAWVNGLPNGVKPPIVLEKGLEWVPFVRIREIGTTLSLNSFISDPQHITSELNPFQTSAELGLSKEEYKVEEKALAFERQSKFKRILLSGRDNLLISGQNQIKLIKRSQSSHQFHFEQLLQKTVEGDSEKYLISISQQQIDLLSQAEKAWNTTILGNLIKHNENLWISKSQSQWSLWMNALCVELDRRLVGSESSKQLATLIYRWVLQKVESLRSILANSLQISSLNAFDSGLVSAIYRNSFHSQQIEQNLIQSSLFVNNAPYFSFSQSILSTNATQNYVFVKFPLNKITVFSTRTTLFKIGDFIISKAIKKENELAEYRKQAEQMKENDFSKPSIYKILKNCLKYADKVKPPEKLIKELQQKKALIKEKEKVEKKVASQIIPDKQLQNTLIQMGFDINVAKKALIQCKNSSLEAAMDLILSGSIKVEPVKILIPKKEWNCESCTLLNPANVAVCGACDAQAPIVDQKQQKKEQAIQPAPFVEQEIKSQKIDEELKEIYAFETNIGFIPLVVGGVFKSQIRFRLFCLNPKFYSNFYQKNDAYVNLINNSLGSYTHEITTYQIQSLSFAYYDQAQLKEKSFAWIPIEDYDEALNESVSLIRFETVGFDKQQFTFKAYLSYPARTKCLTFKINTSNVYLEKQKSFLMIKQQWLEQNVAPQASIPIQNKSKHFENCKQLQVESNSTLQFEAIFALAEQTAEPVCKEVQCVNSSLQINGKPLNLSVIKSPQQNLYPHVLFVSPEKQSYTEGPLKNSLVIGNLQNFKINVEAITLQSKNKEDKINGFIWFSNDYALEPLTRHKFRFEGNQKKLSFQFQGVSASYVIIALEPSQDDKIVEISNVNVYGNLVQTSSIESRKIKYEIPSQNVKILLFGVQQERESQINEFQFEPFITNPKFDLTFLDSNELRKIQGQISPIVRLSIRVKSETAKTFSKIILKNADITGYRLLAVNSSKKYQIQCQSIEQLRKQFHNLFDQYLITSDKSLLQSLISEKYAIFKSEIKEKSLKQFILNHIAKVSFDSNKKFYFQIFINSFQAELKDNKVSLDLQNILMLGLKDENLTAFGLELLLQLNHITNSISSGKLMEATLPSLRQIKEFKAIHTTPYSPYEQKTIFSPYIHQLLIQNKADSSFNSIDRIHQSIVLRKHKFSRSYIIDFFSVHHLRSLDLVLEQSQTQNKMIISIKWIDAHGNLAGSFNKFIDYEQWSQLVGQKNKTLDDNKNFLSIDLKKYQIETRYLIVDCSFTLKPLNGAKIQVQNLIEKDIIPVAYGNYISEQQPNKSYTIDHSKDHRFICKTLNFNKYALQGGVDSFYFEEDEVKPEAGDISALQNKLQLRENKDKWVKLQMNNPNNQNTDFHYTLLCQVAQAVTKSQALEKEALSNEWIVSVVNYIAQNEYSPIQQIGIKAIRHILEHRPDLHYIILNCQFRHPHLISTIFKTNPLLNPIERVKILSQLLQKTDNTAQTQVLANNCLTLIKTITNSEEIDSIRDLAVGLLKTFSINKHEEEICEICNTFGWIEGVDEVFSHSRQLSTKKALVKASKTSQPLLNYLNKQPLNHPSESFWIIFEEIIVKGFKASEFNEIIDKFLKLVKQIGENEEQDGQSFILFERFIKTINKVSFARQISERIIEIYFSLQNRSILLNQFLKSSFLSQSFIREILIEHAIRQLSSLTFSKTSKSNHQHQLSFLIDVFAFIYKEQKPYFHDNKKIKEVLYHITAEFLHKYVNLGGVQGCRNLKQSQINKISLCHYLTLEFSKEDVVNNEDFSKFAYWYVLNFSETSGIDARSLKKFKAIHENIWKVLVSGFKSAQCYAPIIGRIINDILEEARLLKDNRFLTVIYQSRVYAFLKQVFKYFEQSNEKSDFLPVLLKKSSIFTKILLQISQISGFETNENLTLTQKEVANSLKLLNEEKPKDWIAHKQGAKQHVFTVQFNKGSKQFNSLTFESKNLLWLSEIVLGFQFSSQVLAPKEISLQIGQTEETMKLVGNFELIPLESYLIHSVKVFALNFHRPTTKKWYSLRNAPCRFIRIIIKSPYNNYLLEDIDKTASTFQQASMISFLSVCGYEQNGTSAGPNDVHDIVDSLEILSSSKNKELLGELLNEAENINNFKKSLLNISYLMGNQYYGLQLHRFLMRVCQLNIAVGNTMLKEYLQLKNPYLYSKIASEIAGSNLVESGRRASCFIEFILHELQGDKHTELLPFINKFTQLASTLQKMYAINSKISEVSIQVPQKLVKLILKRAERDFSYKKFARLILANQKPLLFTGFSLENLYEELYQSKQASDLLASLITGQPKCTKWFIEKDYIAEIFNAILLQIKENQSPQTITNRLNFLTILCQSSDLKEVITKTQYDLKIFEILVSKDGEKLLSQSSNKQLRERLVQFIARASLGTENEKIIGALLKDSLGSMVLESSQQFVAEIFLPLLNSYNRTTVSLLPYNKSESRLMTDLSILKIQGNQAKVQDKPVQSFKLASQIVTQAENTAFFLKFKENSHHKWGTFNLLANHGKLPSFKSIDIIKKQVLKGQKSILILLDSKVRLGAFFNFSKESSTGKNSIGWTRGSFIFEIDQKGTISVYSYVYPKEDLLVYEHIHKSEFIEENDTLKLKYKNKVVAELFFDSVTPSIISPGALKGKQQEKQELQSAEYWAFDSDSINSYETIFANQQSFAKKLLAQLSDYTFFKSELKANKSLQLLRQEPLYEFPSSITLKELKKSIEIYGYAFSDQNVDKISLRNLKAEQIKDNYTLDTLSKKNAGNDLILELLLETDSLPPLQPKSESNKIQFLPRKGILKYFEENDGVKAMIKVIKKSIGEWKNQVRKEKWEQYAIQLQNFSAFPHFFSAYLKDKDTFQLLLDLLSGLPDKEADGKWDELQVVSSQKLLKIVSDILSMDTTNEFRNYALKNDFMSTILERLRILSGIFKRKYESEVVEEVDNSPSKKEVGEDDGTKKIKKKKGVGYGNDTNSNTKWMKGQNLANLKKQFENIGTILTLVESFLNSKNWNIPKEFLGQLLESSLLPYIQDCLRAGTLLEISKHPQKFTAVLKLIRALAKQQKLLVCLLPLGANYQPSQTQSIQSLLKNLYNISKIFISCLNQNLTQQDKISKQFANDIIETYDLVQQAIEERANLGNNENQITNILSLPLDKKYRELLKDLRFDYIDMKQSPAKIKHHYSSNFAANYTPNHNKMIRLAQELADISTALPHEHTNAVFVRCDKDRVDFMQALIMGSNGTPYGHGAFLFDIYFDDNYPNGPPKVNLTTTGHGKIRFNPNLYSCGKVCLSLLGTWRGSASENWDAKVSTLLQVLLSIQAIIMSEQVYFNEPGFENQQGTEEGQKKNQAYSNIVRYGNVKFAMLENIKNPPKGFEAVIRRHFYLKKDEILEQCKKWLKYAEKRPANYVGLVNDHNVSWSTEFKKSKTQYKQMLEKAVKELQEQLEKLSPPQITDITPKHIAKKQKKRKDESKNALNALQGAKLQQIDVSYEKIEGKELDINDQKVRDRWSRYIGAMGIDAVSRQSKADILILGLGPFGLEVIKNIVLSGCRKLTLCDDEVIKLEDLSGGFFYREEDVGKKRVETIIHKIRQLNSYVKIDSINIEKLNKETIAGYSIVFVSELSLNEQKGLAGLCRESKIKFISADCKGAYCRLVNDFGEFTVLDKNGQQPTEVMLSNIDISEQGLVTLLEGAKHPFEDGEAVYINHVEGMNDLQNKDKSINGTIHTIKVVNYKSFEIGNTLHYQKYIRNGTAKNIKTPVVMKYRPFEASIDPEEKELGFESNIEFFDFSKLANQKLVQRCFIVLDQFRNKNQKYPEPWNAKDAQVFIEMYNALWKEELANNQKGFLQEFSFTCKGYLPPLCAFFGGLAAQQIIKAITQKYKPIHSSVYLEFSEIIPKKEGEGNWTQKELETIYTPSKNRDEGFSMVVGQELTDWVKNAKLFMIGAGAIGCELLKNLAMVGLGTGKEGKIVLTDPDHIENSNLNRQFLFREKHISKPKSSTAAASILLMNPYLKGHISALLERVSDSTKQIFSNKFFQSLTIVANALDNVAARRYVDQRCVENKIPLFESGTLGPKGHVQVIVPYKTQSYGSQNDPVQEGEIPHCTLKMFPEETLHCIEWARDNFGKKFTLQPKALAKYLDKGYKPESDDIKYLNESLTMVTKGPRNFQDCINYAILKFYKYFRDDVMQLLYTYPLDAKTKNGEPFWRLPKRPPTPIKLFNPEDLLQCTFVATLAVLLAKIYQIPFPQNFRTEKERFEIGKAASQIKIQEFVPSDEKAKAILKETTAQEKKQKKQEEQSQITEVQKVQITINTKNEEELHKQLLLEANGEFLIKHQQFEKDQDGNGHIDFIYSMANLRAINYKLDPMDWITTKLKAGRIVPALATTTSCVAGLQTLEICKYLKKIKIDNMRNSYLNLAVPSIQMSEPGEVKKTKITDKLIVTLWDRWELECTDQTTFGYVYKALYEKYELFAKGVLQGMSRIDHGKSQGDQKAFLASHVLDKLEKEDNYIDIVVLFTLNENDDKILEGLPPVRLIFKK